MNSDPKARQPEAPSPEWQAAAAQDPLVGTTIDDGKYTILGLLGKGGMSIVYKARQNILDRIVAIKTLKLQMLADPKVVRRFQREVTLLSNLDHPNIVGVYDCVMVGNQPYFVMDCLTGQSLQELLKEKGPLLSARAQHIFIQVASAVEHAHRNGVIHRDIKPANIMVTPGSAGRDMVKVVDFGLARLAEDAQRLTATGEIWGSPLYMSPEQASGQDLDARSDIYSLGTVMFETLTGLPPFRGKNFMETMSMQVHMPAPAMKSVAPNIDVPPAFEELVRRALEKEPGGRIQSMSQVKEALKSAIPGSIYKTHSNLAALRSPSENSVDTLVLSKQSLNGYTYKPKEKGFSIKLLAGTMIALSVIVLVCLVVPGLVWHSANAPAPTVVTPNAVHYSPNSPNSPPSPSPVSKPETGTIEPVSGHAAGKEEKLRQAAVPSPAVIKQESRTSSHAVAISHRAPAAEVHKQAIKPRKPLPQPQQHTKQPDNRWNDLRRLKDSN